MFLLYLATGNTPVATAKTEYHTVVGLSYGRAHMPIASHASFHGSIQPVYALRGPNGCHMSNGHDEQRRASGMPRTGRILCPVSPQEMGAWGIGDKIVLYSRHSRHFPNLRIFRVRLYRPNRQGRRRAYTFQHNLYGPAGNYSPYSISSPSVSHSQHSVRPSID